MWKYEVHVLDTLSSTPKNKQVLAGINMVYDVIPWGTFEIRYDFNVVEFPLFLQLLEHHTDDVSDFKLFKGDLTSSSKEVTLEELTRIEHREEHLHFSIKSTDYNLYANIRIIAYLVKLDNRGGEVWNNMDEMLRTNLWW